jgi:hypothetical protein
MWISKKSQGYRHGIVTINGYSLDHDDNAVGYAEIISKLL